MFFSDFPWPVIFTKKEHKAISKLYNFSQFFFLLFSYSHVLILILFSYSHLVHLILKVLFRNETTFKNTFEIFFQWIVKVCFLLINFEILRFSYFAGTEFRDILILYVMLQMYLKTHSQVWDNFWQMKAL